MINNEIYKSDGFLDIQRLDAKLNSAFNVMQSYINGLFDERVTKQLLGAQLKSDKIAHVRHLLFFLISLDAEKRKDQDTTDEADWEPNSYYIELFKTEALRDYYICLLDNTIVNSLFRIFELDYAVPEGSIKYGIGRMIIEGEIKPFTIN